MPSAISRQGEDDLTDLHLHSKGSTPATGSPSTSTSSPRITQGRRVYIAREAVKPSNAPTGLGIDHHVNGASTYLQTGKEGPDRPLNLVDGFADFDLFSFSDHRPLGAFDLSVPRLDLPRDDSRLDIFAKGEVEAVPFSRKDDVQSLPESPAQRTERLPQPIPILDKSISTSPPRDSNATLSALPSQSSNRAASPKSQAAEVQPRPPPKPSQSKAQHSAASRPQLNQRSSSSTPVILPNVSGASPEKKKGIKKFLSSLKPKSAKAPLIRPDVLETDKPTYSRSSSKQSLQSAKSDLNLGSSHSSERFFTPSRRSSNLKDSPILSRLNTDGDGASPSSTRHSVTPPESLAWSPDDAMVAAYSQASTFLSQDFTTDRPKRRAPAHDLEVSPLSIPEKDEEPITPGTAELLPLPLTVEPAQDGSCFEGDTVVVNRLYKVDTPVKPSTPAKTESLPSTPQSKHDVYANFDKPLPDLGFLLRHGPRETFSHRPSEAPQKPVDVELEDSENKESLPLFPSRSASPTKKAFLARLGGGGGRQGDIEAAGISGKGDLYSDFAIIKQLGVGSFGTVFKAKWLIFGDSGLVSAAAPGEVQKAEDDDQGVVIAIKRLDKVYPSWEKAKSQCIELRALCSIKPHSNLVRLHEAFVDPTCHNLVLIFEAMQANLVDLIKSRRGHFLPAYVVGHIMCQIALGLEHIHHHNMIHRDMKPDNILYAIRDGNYVVKISDFGLTRSRTGRPLTEYIGTIWYRAPENALCSKDYTAKIDCWGWGCIAMEMINLSPLFPAKDTFRLLQMQTAVLGSPRNWNNGTSLVTPSIGGGPWPEGRQMAKKLGYTFQEVRPSPLGHRIQDHSVPAQFIKVIASTLRWSQEGRSSAMDLVRSSLWKELGVEPRPNSKRSPMIESTEDLSLSPAINKALPLLGPSL